MNSMIRSLYPFGDDYLDRKLATGILREIDRISKQPETLSKELWVIYLFSNAVAQRMIPYLKTSRYEVAVALNTNLNFDDLILDCPNPCGKLRFNIFKLMGDESVTSPEESHPHHPQAENAPGKPGRANAASDETGKN